MTLARPPVRKGDNWEGRTTEVPIEMMQALKLQPLPVTLSGTSNRVFTLNGSTTSPAILWNGDDFIYLKSSVAYTWTTSGTQAVLSSAGAETTEAEAGQTIGVYYMYLDNDGNAILPSQTAPDYVEDSYQCGYLGHPGTSRAKNWIYVGFMLCDAATPTFIAMTKQGYTWHLASQGRATITSFVAHSSWDAVLPDMGDKGMTVAGYIDVPTSTTAVVNTITVSGHSTGSHFGAVRATGAASASSADFSSVPFSGLGIASGGKIYSINTSTTAGNVYVTQITDVV